MTTIKLLRLTATAAKVAASTAGVYAQARAGIFPAPIKINGSRASAWIESEIDAVLAARAAGADDNAVRALVGRMTADRQKAAKDAFEKAGLTYPATGAARRKAVA